VNLFIAAFWAEALKARRSRISALTGIGFLLLPLAGGLFMIILKDPEQARAWGLISTKAQLAAGVADWPAYFGMLAQGIAGGGAILFALITSWVFGREFSDHTAKDLMALPTPRATIVTAKFALLALWCLALTILVFAAGLAVGAAVRIPGWSVELARTSVATGMAAAALTILLMPFVALFASSGRGYLPPMGWTILVLVIADIVGVLGWGDWFPWAVPVLLSGMVKPHADLIGLHSYLSVAVACAIGIAATYVWWQAADQSR
jgi:ABC-2 type transport system permease protein